MKFKQLRIRCNVFVGFAGIEQKYLLKIVLIAAALEMLLIVSP